MYIYKYLYLYTYTCISRTHIHTYIYIRLHTYIFIHVHIYLRCEQADQRSVAPLQSPLRSGAQYALAKALHQDARV